jgi:7-cyano-7-deazaguanine synthase in queuosine biosynthesis
MKNKKTIGVLFSGGLDSTYMLMKALDEGHEVVPFYIDVKNNLSKSKVEQHQAKKILDLINKKYDKFLRLDVVASINVSGDPHNLKFKQVPLWILGMCYLGSRIDEIHVGYVMNDDAISYLDDIKRIFKAYHAILETKPKLVFPISKMKKQEIQEELPSEFKSLVVSCEDPYLNESDGGFEYYECGRCVACQRAKHDGVHYNRRYFKPENAKVAYDSEIKHIEPLGIVDSLSKGFEDAEVRYELDYSKEITQ